MSRKSLQSFAVTLALAAIAVASPGFAMKIDPELASALAGKDPSARVPVLVIYGGENRLSADALAGLDKASPQERREQTLAALKKRLQVTATRQEAAFHISVKAHALFEMVTQHIHAFASPRRKTN